MKIAFSVSVVIAFVLFWLFIYGLTGAESARRELEEYKTRALLPPPAPTTTLVPFTPHWCPCGAGGPCVCHPDCCQCGDCKCCCCSGKTVLMKQGEVPIDKYTTCVLDGEIVPYEQVKEKGDTVELKEWQVVNGRWVKYGIWKTKDKVTLELKVP